MQPHINFFYWAVGSMIGNIVLLFMLLQPNIVKALHSHLLTWKPKSTDGKVFWDAEHDMWFKEN